MASITKQDGRAEGIQPREPANSVAHHSFLAMEADGSSTALSIAAPQPRGRSEAVAPIDGAPRSSALCTR